MLWVSSNTVNSRICLGLGTLDGGGWFALYSLRRVLLSPRQAHLLRPPLKVVQSGPAKSPLSGPPGSHSPCRWKRGDSSGFYSNQRHTRGITALGTERGETTAQLLLPPCFKASTDFVKGKVGVVLSLVPVERLQADLKGLYWAEAGFPESAYKARRFYNHILKSKTNQIDVKGALTLLKSPTPRSCQELH